VPFNRGGVTAALEYLSRAEVPVAQGLSPAGRQP